MRYLQSFAAQDQRVGVTPTLQSSLPIEFQNARGVRRAEPQDQFERKTMFGHALANLVVEGARARDRRVRRKRQPIQVAVVVYKLTQLFGQVFLRHVYVYEGPQSREGGGFTHQFAASVDVRR